MKADGRELTGSIKVSGQARRLSCSTYSSRRAHGHSKLVHETVNVQSPLGWTGGKGPRLSPARAGLCWNLGTLVPWNRLAGYLGTLVPWGNETPVLSPAVLTCVPVELFEFGLKTRVL
jgi:hypothetical protein